MVLPKSLYGREISFLSAVKAGYGPGKHSTYRYTIERTRF